MPPSQNASSLLSPSSSFKFTNGDETSPNQTLSLFKFISTQCQQFGTLHVSMTSSPLSPALPLFLHVAASRTRACWIRLAPTHQLSTLPCPLELHPPFSGTTRSLDTPAVGSPMMCCLPYAHKLGCLRLGRSRQRISTPLTQLSLLPPPPIFACGSGVNVP